MLTEIVSKLKQSTFVLCEIESKIEKLYRGSCFLVSNRGYFLTCEHLLEDIDENKIHLANPHLRLMFREVEIVYKDKKKDFAILKSDVQISELIKVNPKLDLTTEQILNIDFNDYEDGTEVVGYGYPFPTDIIHVDNENRIIYTKLHGKATRGIIASHFMRHQVRINFDMYEIDTFFNEGSSGGPIVETENGTIIGIISHREIRDIIDEEDGQIKYTERINSSWALPIVNFKNEIMKFVNF